MWSTMLAIFLGGCGVMGQPLSSSGFPSSFHVYFSGHICHFPPPFLLNGSSPFSLFILAAEFVHGRDGHFFRRVTLLAVSTRNSCSAYWCCVQLSSELGTRRRGDHSK